jgi:hypothetical protein
MAIWSSSGQAEIPLQDKKILERLNQGSGVIINQISFTIPPGPERYFDKRSKFETLNLGEGESRCGFTNNKYARNQL